MSDENILSMRRRDREITDFDEILDVLRRADTIRLGLNGEPYPYVVPLSFGFEAQPQRNAHEDAASGRVSIFVHGAADGRKHELIARDNRVCVEAGIFHRYVKYGEGEGSSITTEYESVIGYGYAEAVTGGEAARGMTLLLEHCGYPGFEYDMPAPEAMRMYKINLTRVTGKRRFV